ncbi:MAG: hypothetical protein V1907_00525 [Candidatus Kerfeldbacteria bacterium]
MSIEPVVVEFAVNFVFSASAMPAKDRTSASSAIVTNVRRFI